MDTDILSPEECTDRNNFYSSQRASLCIPEQGINKPFEEHDVDDIRGIAVNVVPREPQIITFCAEKGPPIVQDREQPSISNIANVEETLSYKDEAQHKVSH